MQNQILELNPFLYHQSNYLKAIIANPSEINFLAHEWPMRNAILSSLALTGAEHTPLFFAHHLSFEDARCRHCTEAWTRLESENREYEINRFLQSAATGTGTAVIDTRDWIHFKLAADSCAFKPWKRLDVVPGREVTLFELIVLEGGPALRSGMMQLLYHFYWEKHILSHLLMPFDAPASLLLVAASSTKEGAPQTVAQLLHPLFFLKRLGVVEREAQLLQAMFQSLTLALAHAEGVPKALQTLALALVGSKLYRKQIEEIISAPEFPLQTWQWLAKNELAFVDVDNGRWVVWVGVGVAVAFLVSAVISVLMWRWVESKRGTMEALSVKAAEAVPSEDHCSLLDE